MKTKIRISPTFFDLMEISLACFLLYDVQESVIIFLFLTQLANSCSYLAGDKQRIIHLLVLIFCYAVAALVAFPFCMALGYLYEPFFAYPYFFLYLLPLCMAFHLLVPVTRFILFLKSILK